MGNRVCTFGALFQDYLAECIGLGGEVEAIVTLVNVYQGRDAADRGMAFREWLENELFMCERCRHEFKADHDVAERDDVLCTPCSAWDRDHE